MLLIQTIRRNASFRAHELATIDGDEQRSWAEFADRVARAADGLRQMGVNPGDRIGILALNSARYLEAQFAIWWMGAVLVPMNIRWSVEENLYCIRDAGVTTLMFDGAFADTAAAIAAQSEGLRQILLCAATDGPVPSFEDLVSSGQAGPAAESMPDSLAGIYYTGGTTGFPKGVMLSFLSLWSAAIGIVLANRMEAGGRMLHATPMFHLADGGMSHGAMIVGATHIFVPRFDPTDVIATIDRHQVTDVLLVPTMIGMLQSCDAYAPDKLKSLRCLSFGASPIPAPILEKLQADLPSVSLLHVYGQTEMGPTISFLEPRFQVAGGNKALSVGKPFACVEIRIMDADGNDVPANVPGEILARGPSAMTGYWNKPEETARTVVDGWVRTGDVAYKDDDGFLFICDRVKDMIITGGENVFCAEVENAVAAHPAVAQVAVIGIPDPDYGECVHAVIVPKPGFSLTADELKEHCKSLIANYKCPRSIELRDALPTSGAGKILKRDLREPHWAGHERAVH
ncbi:class I adenylate-forming enzyme family protein [Blastomonas fulva]|uniref:class I adenylate-forming enzyme family protein n=1 Tax=Blastomonas fulva TaxID=1550728 RepID=UPI0024E23731|nr:long-chain-fatty-acid--CoA ligase [Blastomonas fulva]MDK2759307.1 long-chain-fatty-acid--CoA ligase [Blastomonas fulva]